MFALTADAPEAAPVFAAAARVLGADPREFVRMRDEAALHANAAGQILCVTQALAGFAALRIAPGTRLTIAGYSIGELAAWGCAGLFSPEAAIELAGARAELMDASSGPEDGLAFVRGLDRDCVDGLCARHAAAVAIVNPGAVFVLGGGREDLQRALRGGDEPWRRQCRTAQGQCRRAYAAARPGRRAFPRGFGGAELSSRVTGVRLLSGVDAGRVLDLAKGLDKLAAQIARTIDWAGCLDACVEAGADSFLELALAALWRRWPGRSPASAREACRISAPLPARGTGSQSA